MNRRVIPSRGRCWRMGIEALGVAGMLVSAAFASLPPALMPGTSGTNGLPQLKLAVDWNAFGVTETPGFFTNIPPLTTAATNTGVPREIDPALRGTQDLLTSSNLLPNAAELQARQEKLVGYQELLEMGRQQRQSKDFALAEKSFIGVMESPAPIELKRSALLDLALLAQDTRQYPRAQQLYAQYLQRFHDDPSVPEVMLRQGLLYREMGVPNLALAKFYASMSSALNLKLDRLDYYQRLVLQAQTEIADTYYLQGKFSDAAEYFQRLLRLENPELNKSQILYKLIRAYAGLGRGSETIAQAQSYLAKYPGTAEVPEVRFLLAEALKKAGRKEESMQQVLALLTAQQATGKQSPENWLYWQQRAGNDIANELYKEGDLLNALAIYLNLAPLNPAPGWQMPAWYQAGLVYERLQQPQKAVEMYDRVLQRQKEFGTNSPSPALATVVDMARWRKGHIGWQTQAELLNQELEPALRSETKVATP